MAFTVADLADAGVKRISLGSALTRLSFTAVLDAVREIKQEGTFRFASKAVGFSELEDHFGQ
jgi:2-methylisocitrate lyase-like PEP mutase family enzyme